MLVSIMYTCKYKMVPLLQIIDQSMELEAPYSASVALRGGLRLLRLAEFVRYNRAAIGRPSKWQSMNSLVASCLGSTWLSNKPTKVSR